MRELETGKRLSDSLIWKLQEKAYTQFGPDAWAIRGVPFYLTSNPLIANQFSHVILGYLRDCVSGGSPYQLDMSQPFYIFDLGAGSGRLGFLILKELLPMVKSVISRRLRICYVMTDIAERNLFFYQTHPQLRKYVEQGNLDFALYHHKQQAPLQLVSAKLILEGVSNPIALVCTYYFDTLPQDLFKLEKGKLYEGRISVSLPRSEKETLKPEWIMDLQTRYDYVPVLNPATYYSTIPDCNFLLQDYTNEFENASFLLPLGGVESLRYFAALTNDRLLMVAADQGVATQEQVREWGEPKIFKHASFSMGVSYHLLEKFYRRKGGFGLLTQLPDPTYVVMSGVLGGRRVKFPNTTLAFSQQVDRFEPADYWRLTRFTAEQLDQLPLNYLLLLLKFGNWDPVNFSFFFPYLEKKLAAASDQEKNTLRWGIQKTWENFYSVGSEEGAFIMNLGVVLFRLKDYRRALFFFEKALELTGENEIILMNLAKCSRRVGDLRQANLYFQQALLYKNTSKI